MSTTSHPASAASAAPSTASASASAANGAAEDGAGSVQKVKRGRRNNTKVKSGCSNCKRRRIKCDEKRPVCTQCVRHNKACLGYPLPSRKDGPTAYIGIAPKPPAVAQPQSAPVIAPLQWPTVLSPQRVCRRRQLMHPELRPIPNLSSQPSNGLAFQNSEGLYFDLFRVRTESELSGYFNSTFWAQRVLQECHSENAIRHAVVALGALYKTLKESSQPVPAPAACRINHMDSAMPHWQAAVKQYSEACNTMLSLSGESPRANRTRLIVSILLACFDSFIGDHKQAIIQVQAGLGLLERLSTHHAHGRFPSQDGHVEEDLVVMFTRLAIQAKSYDMAFHFPQPYVIRLTSKGQPADGTPRSETSSPGSSPEVSLPYRFGSLLEARLASDKLCEKLLRFIERLQLAMDNPSNVLPASWKQYGLSLKGQLDTWTEAFELIFRCRLDPGISHLERSGISALKMFQINTNILFMMMFCDTEVQFDAFLPHFKGIVDLGWEVVSADERRAAAEQCPHPAMCQHQHSAPKGTCTAGTVPTPHMRPSFSADLGIVPPLFVVATKCREPRVRRQAIQLLRSSARREGMWDSELAANIGQWIMQVEEFDEQAPPGAMPTKPIPEEKRVMVKSVDFDLRARFADLRVGTRALYDGCPDDRFRKTRIAWLRSTEEGPRSFGLNQYYQPSTRRDKSRGGTGLP
ncbi:Sterol regulatory element-binding protein ECM22 [Tolypocladium ophioglossoides CBS 100239]|uniref:Sterol regulatory element-binding protein ECM22 n=1 Tax=Tolypocladium ophioglossoides (strain CBS 100239) TaxID=1163406 RepID=A0A0L0NI75_TOLOC|nr:Sterol regulatory element-binding protein ECM22 [Tolypocladium ophioglossoides CBS 100239]